MSKLPYMQFFPTDYLVDTAVLSLGAQGAWMRILCALHASDTRGTKTWKLDAWARYIGVTTDVTSQILAEISEAGVGNVEDTNGNVTLTNRRMLTESITKEQTRLRVERHRNKTRAPDGETECNNDCNASGNADVTPKKSEVRSQKSETIQAPAAADAVGEPVASSPPPARKAEPKPRERNPLFDALAIAEGNQLDAITKPAAGAIATALSQIRKVSPDVTPEEIQRRADNYRASMPGATLTATALAKHWGRMDDPPLQFRPGSGRAELGGAVMR